MSDDSVFTGGRELDAMLQSLSAKIEKNIMRSALAAGARVLRDEARSNVPEKLGALKRSIRVTTKSKGGVVSASVKAGSRKAFYWRFVEFGTTAHPILPRAAGGLLVAGTVVRALMHPGARPHPFMRPALDTKSAAAIEAVGEQIRKRLTAEGINTPAPVVT